MICVIVVVAYLLTRSRMFAEVLDGHPVVKTQLFLIAVFGAISVYGTVSNVQVADAIVNVRDLGPMVGGLVGGPVVGIGAGLIGAAYRYSLGGFTVVPCTIATILAGIFGGLIWYLNHRKFPSILVAVIFAAAMESLHMILTLLLCSPFERAWEVVSAVALPMIIANSAGMFVFAMIIHNLINERRMQADRDNLMREMERKNTELAIAAEIQQSFLPDKIAPFQGFDIAAKSVMAKEVGGDFFDVIPLELIPFSENRLGIMIADVSGKGIPAALYMALSRIVVRVNATWHKDRPDLVIRDANAIISADSKYGMFVTLFYGYLDSSSKTLTYVNAGHNPPVLYRPSTREFRELPATGIAIGLRDDAPYSQDLITLDSGDILVLYTDGVTEAENARQEMFGEERMREIIRKTAAENSQVMINRILESVRTFTGNYPQSDDITLMIIKTG
jgi:sigma-B regulation protein RsbU (phosphoserine phosphatase)